MTPDDPLLKILACPLDKGPLLLVPDDGTHGQALYNPRLHRRYPIVDGIPQLLPSSGEQLPEDAHEQLLKQVEQAGRATP
ncbi:Trm112 family protein [Streptomyces sp. NPDC052225]|uniref:Trm112 family protein n=1 Tax=Streptomyces sp. NPDC052225 TaxID=3154949 RepID=UPI00343AA3D0